MQFKDYYKILGIDPTASSFQIRSAFHRLAIKYHPDKNNGDNSFIDKFREISEANEVLNDSQKKTRYDTIRKEWILKQLSTKEHTNQYNQKTKTYKTYHSRFNTINESCENFEFSDFFKTIFNSASPYSTYTKNAVFRKNCYESIVHISFEEVLKGAEKEVIIHNKKIPIFIHAGMRDGQVIRYPSVGHTAIKYLLITIRIDKHPQFDRCNQDLSCNLDLDFYTAILGGKKEIRMIDGSTIRFTIPEGTDNGTVFRLKGQGLPISSNCALRGDLFVKAILHIPENLTKQEIEAFKHLSNIRNSA